MLAGSSGMIAVWPKSFVTSAISIPKAENVAGPGGMIVVGIASSRATSAATNAPAPPKPRIEKSLG